MKFVLVKSVFPYDIVLSPLLNSLSLFLYKTLAVYFALKSMLADAISLSKYKKNRPENAFREVVSTREVYGEKWRIFQAQNFSGALRNTRKSLRELCWTVSRPKKFSGLLRNARLSWVAIYVISDLRKQTTDMNAIYHYCFDSFWNLFIESVIFSPSSMFRCILTYLLMVVPNYGYNICTNSSLNNNLKNQLL